MYFNLGEMERTFYFIFVTLGTCAIFIYNLFQIKYKKQFLSIVSERAINKAEKKGLKLPTATIAAVIEIFLIFILFYYSAGTANVLFGKCIGMSANYFGTIYFSPLLLVLGCYILGLDVEKVFDMIAPCYPLGLIFSKTACFMAGCCRGIEWEHGIYNYDVGLYEVPIQLIEASVALIIFVILFSLRKKFKRGTGFPLYLILYSSTRFFTEFLRVEPDIFMNLKLYHFCCISGVIVGAVLYVIALKFSDRISQSFTENNRMLRFAFKYFEKKKKQKSIKKAKKQKEKQRREMPIVHHKKKKKKNKNKRK